MSADAIARLRAELDVMGAHGMRYCEQVRTDDLRALLDRAALLDEALDALEASPDTGRHTVDVTESPCQCSRCRFVDLSTAVLAKAGWR